MKTMTKTEKRYYQQPVAEVFNMKLQGILCNSIGGGGDSPMPSRGDEFFTIDDSVEDDIFSQTD